MRGVACLPRQPARVPRQRPACCGEAGGGVLCLHGVTQGVRGCVPSGEAEGDRERRAQHCLECFPRTWLACESKPWLGTRTAHGMPPAASWPQPKARGWPIHRQHGTPGHLGVPSKAKAGWDAAPHSRCHRQLACSAEERRQLVAIVVGEGCAAPRRVFGGGFGAAGRLDARIRGSVGLHHCCVAACGACVWRGRPSGRKARAACWRGGVVKRDPNWKIASAVNRLTQTSYSR